MSQKTHIDIKVTLDELRLSLQKLIKSEHSSLITEVIVNNLKTTEVGLEHLYKSFSGMKVVPKFKVLDEIYVKYQYLGSWRNDKNTMIEHNMLFKDHVKAVVIGIDMTKNYSVQIKYTGRDKGKEPEVHEHYVPEIACHLITKDFLGDDEEPF